MIKLFIPLALGLTSGLALADPAQILSANAARADMGWHFEVTVRHNDVDWDHFADGWEVVDSSGNRLGYRELYHPHIDEQPFTRSLSGIMIPDGLREVFVRVHCSRDGWSEQKVAIKLAR